MHAAEQKMLTTDIPEGFEPLVIPPGFVHHCGGFYLHAERPVLAVRITSAHLNSLKTAHGGFLATLADCAFGAIFKRQLGLPVPPVTVNLNVDYFSAVREGDWVEAYVEIHKAGRTFANGSCMLKVGELPMLRASGIFAVPKSKV